MVTISAFNWLSLHKFVRRVVYRSITIHTAPPNQSSRSFGWQLDDPDGPYECTNRHPSTHMPAAGPNHLVVTANALEENVTERNVRSTLQTTCVSHRLLHQVRVQVTKHSTYFNAPFLARKRETVNHNSQPRSAYMQCRTLMCCPCLAHGPCAASQYRLSSSCSASPCHCRLSNHRSAAKQTRYT